MADDGKRHLVKQSYCSSEAGCLGEPPCCPAGPPCCPAGPPCCRCARRRRVSPLTCLAICFLVLTYNLLGGFLFLALEGTTPTEETAVAASKPNLSQSQVDLRSKTVERLWSITEDLNILYKENWTKLAAKELMDFQKVLIKSIRSGSTSQSRMSDGDGPDYRWTFSSSFLYALTLITTIGAGDVAPRSAAGRLVAVGYACVGVPIVMLYLSTIGDALARNFRLLYARLRPPPRPSPTTRYSFGCKQLTTCDNKDKFGEKPRTPFQAALNLDSLNGDSPWTCRDHTRVPIVLSLFIISLYVALGTFVFHKTERWNLVEGCYFSFSSLATIGFGDLRPGSYGSSVSAKLEDVAIGVCCIYILVGIVVVAMCFNLIQEDLRSAVRSVTALCASGARVRGAGDSGHPSVMAAS